jgi:aspartyl protease family protein
MDSLLRTGASGNHGTSAFPAGKPQIGAPAHDAGGTGVSTPPRRPQPLFWILIGAVIVVAGVMVFAGDSATILGLERTDFASIAYFLILLVFVGSALLGRRLGAAEIVRSAAAWLAILLVLVGAYAYREELTGVGTRLLGVLVPGVPVPGRLAGAPDDSVMVVRSLGGHFAVRAEVNAVPLNMMVDTGASFVTLTLEDAVSTGADPADLEFSMPVRTANGTMDAAPITIGRLAVGPIERENVAALVAPPGSLDESLLGLSFLNTLRGYAISGDRLVLTP